MKSLFSTFDIVKFKNTATVANPEYFKYYGIVRESDNMNTFAEWVFSKNSKESKEVIGDIGWVKNSDIEKVGSLFHMLDNKLTAVRVAAPIISAPSANTSVEVSAPVVSAEEIVAPVERVKRKYVRKPGSAKPGPKPKASTAAQEDALTTDVKSTVSEETSSPASSDVIYVDRPFGRYREIYADRFEDVVVTGKFDAFPCREKMLELIRNNRCGLSWKLTTRIDWGTDFAIVGKKPGPAKMEKFKQYRIPTITEEQFLAFIGSPKYKFKDQMTAEEKVAMQQTA